MAAGSTYTPIATTTLGSAQSSVVFGSGGTIPSTYTDLVLICDFAVTTALASSFINFNGDTGSNYSSTWIYGDGSNANSTRYSSTTAIRSYIAPASAAGRRTMILNIQNYANASIYKTVIGRCGNAGDVSGAVAGLWRSTAAINTFTLTNGGGYNFDSGSTFTLYGIAAA